MVNQTLQTVAIILATFLISPSLSAPLPLPTQNDRPQNTLAGGSVGQIDNLRWVQENAVNLCKGLGL